MSSYDAVVDTTGGGDYKSVAAAFADGKVNVFVRPGTYNETVDVVIPNGGSLVGALRGLTIIDFGGNSASVVCNSGYEAVESKGTIDVTSASADVVGTSTTFTNLSPGDCILIANNTYIIATITDDSNLTLLNNYNGQTESGLSYRALTMQAYNRIVNLTIRNSTTAGVALSGCRRFRVEELSIDTCSPNMVLNDCAEGFMRYIFSEFSDGVGINLNGVETTTLSSMYATSNVSHGLTCVGKCANLLFHDVDCSSNGGNGIYVNADTFSNCNMTNCAFKHNVSNGVYVSASADMFVLNASNVDSNGDNGALSLGSRGMMTSCVFRNNIDTGLDTSGDDVLVGQCIGSNNYVGARVSGDRNIINGSCFTDSALDCGQIMSGALTTIVMACHWDGAANTTLNDNGTQTFTTGSLP